MSWIIVIAIGIVIGWTLNSVKVQDHTDDDEALPCPVCRTASPMKTLGYHVCPKCASRWLPQGSWVIRFRCGNCGAAPVKITQDPYISHLFSLRFSCGRTGNYNDHTKAKHDRKPCGADLRDKIAQTETWQPVPETTQPEVSTKVDPKRPDGPPQWVVDNNSAGTDYDEETGVTVG